MAWSLGRRISAGICVLVVALLGLLLGVSNVWIARSVQQRIAADLAQADQSVAEVLRLRLKELGVQTRLLADAPQVRALVADAAPSGDTALSVAQAGRTLLGSDLLMVADADGRLLVSATEPQRRGENAATDPAIAAALSGRNFEEVSVTAAGIYQVIGVPLRSDDRVRGALVASFAVEEALLVTLEKLTNAYVAIWSDGVVQVSTRARPVFGVLAHRLSDSRSAGASPGEAGSTMHSDGYLLRVGQIGTTGVSYALARSLHEELAFYYDLRRRLLATGVSVLALALAAGILFARRVTRPVQALAAGALRLGAGDLGARVAVTSRDEVGELADAFNRMAAEIQSRVEHERQLAASRVLLNEELKGEIAERLQAQREVMRLNEDLEARVLARTADLEAANRQLESFSYSVSHDLRGPLRRLHGFASMLADEAGARLTEAEHGLVDRIHHAATSMDQLVEHLLEFSHVGHREPERDLVDLSAMAAGVAEELASLDPDRRVSVRIADDLAARGDAALLRVVVQNLLSNAWKFTAGRPDPSIEFGLAARTDDGHCYFVRDNGAGFDMADSDRLFRVFERLHSAHDFKGHGIGLATVRRIVEHHGGRIWAEGSPGAGATFHFTLGRFEEAGRFDEAN